MNHEPCKNQPNQYQCPHCGAALEADAPIDGMRVDCPACGREFVAAAPAAVPPAAPAGGRTSRSPAGKGRAKIWIFGMIALGLAAILVAELCLRPPRSLGKGELAGETRTIRLPGGARMEMVWCPPGTFTMGRPEGEEWREFRPASQSAAASQSAEDGDWLEEGLKHVAAGAACQPSWEFFMRNTYNSPFNLHKDPKFEAWMKKEAREEKWQALWSTREGEDQREEWEMQHPVTLTKGFWMAKTEVTQSQWKSVMGRNPSKHKGNGRLPVESVSWEQCQLFCQRAGLQLPTEAQWEYACRAGSPEAYGGTGVLDEMGWFRDNCRETQVAGKKAANAWGLHDMHGNVEEWCQDFSSLEMVHSGEAVTDPDGTGIDYFRVVRGGSYSDGAKRCRSAFRCNSQEDGEVNRGFRPVLVP